MKNAQARASRFHIHGAPWIWRTPPFDGNGDGSDEARASRFHIHGAPWIRRRAVDMENAAFRWQR